MTTRIAGIREDDVRKPAPSVLRDGRVRSIAGALAVLDQPAASPPLPVPGPPGPPGEPGPAGPQGPPGFGFDPARLAALEQEVAFLEDLILTSAMYLPI